MAHVKKQKFRAVILQLEEIVADTASFEIDAWVRCARQLGITDAAVEERIEQVEADRLARWMLETSGNDDQTTEQLLAQKERFYQASIGHLSPKDLSPGIAPLLKDLKKNGIRIAVASARVNASDAVEQLNVGDFFDDAIDGDGCANLWNQVASVSDRLEAFGADSIVIIDSEEAPFDGQGPNWLVVAVGSKDPVDGAVWTIENTGELTYEALKQKYREVID